MRILLTGLNGQVGQALREPLSTIGHVHAFDRTGLDLADSGAIRRACREVAPSLIVNAAAYTAVDRAESEPELALAVNGVAPGVFAEEARRLDATLVHYSTDYVFDGAKRSPYLEGDEPAPINAYGRSKWEGERRIAAAQCKHLVFRTSWVYGPRGKNFLLTMLKLAEARDELRIVDDQRGSPTSSLFLASATLRALRSIPPRGVASGIYHLTSSGTTTWARFAEAIFARTAARGAARAPRVVRIGTSAYPTPARRPAYSVLSCKRFSATFGFSPPPWQSQLEECLRQLPPPDAVN